MQSLSKKSLLFLIPFLAACSSNEFVPTHVETQETRIAFAPKQAERFILPNGLRVFFLEDRELPKVQGQVLLPGGALREPVGQAGVALASSELLRDGGTIKSSPEELDSYLDTHGASIESSLGDEFTSVQFSSLSEDFSEVFARVFDVILHPRFDQKRFQLWKLQTLDSIHRRNESSENVAAITFQYLLYQHDQIRSQMITSKNLEYVKINQLKAFHQAMLSPKKSILMISGAISRGELESQLLKLTVDWKEPLREIADVQPAPEIDSNRTGAQVYLVRMPFQQATIIAGHISLPRQSAFQFEVPIFNRYFGFGGFGGMLFNEIRTKRGLAYTVDGGFAPATKTGIFTIEFGTKNNSATDAFLAATEETKKIQANNISDDRLFELKDGVRRGYVFGFSDPSSIVSRAGMLSYLGYPDDFDASYLKKLQKVSSDRILELAKSEIHPENMIVVVVGNISQEELSQKLTLPVKEISFDEVPKI